VILGAPGLGKSGLILPVNTGIEERVPVGEDAPYPHTWNVANNW